MTIFFSFAVSSGGIHLFSFVTFPICFKCQMTAEWSKLSSSATSHVVVRGSAFMMVSADHCRFPTAGHCAPHLQALVSFPELLEPPPHCTFVTVPGPNALLMLRVISTALRTILNSNKEITRICFLSNIISIV